MLGALAGDVIGSVYEALGEKRFDFPLFSAGSRFTDDSAMTVAVALAILDRRPYADAMREVGRRYPLAGYGKAFGEWLLAPVQPPPYGSHGNGAAMRAVPVGWATRSLDEALAEARRSAEPSHDHPGGVRGAQAVAAAVFLARTGHGKARIRRELGRRFGYDLDRRIADLRPGYAWDSTADRSVPESIISFLDADDFEHAVRNAVSLGGDADTMACIAGGIAEAYWGGVPAAIEAAVRARLPADFIAVLDRFRAAYPVGVPSRLPEDWPDVPDPEGGAAPIADAAGHAAAVAELVARIGADREARQLAADIERIVRFELGPGVEPALRLAARLSAPAAPAARRTALISDIHGHLAGLRAVLDDIARQDCDRIVCLGDLVEGGPDNEAVIELLRAQGIPCVRGNHDEINDLSLSHEARSYLRALPESIVERDTLFVHISPRPIKRKLNHVTEAWNVFDETPYRLIFVGHVHVPLIFGARCADFGSATLHAFDYNRPFALDPDDRYIVSVGSVGYGRDAVGKLRYAIHDRTAGTVELRAVDGPLLPFDHALR